MPKPIVRPRTPLLVDLLRALANRRGYRSQFVRDTLFRFLPRIASHVAVDGRDGIRYFVDTRDTEVGRTIFVTGEFCGAYREKAVAIIEREGLLRRDGLLVNVGAHIGSLVLPMIRRHGFTRALALEPDEANASLLELNVLANQLSSVVTVVRAAATDHDGDVVLERDAHNTGGHRVRTGVEPRDGDYGEEFRETVKVKGHTLDGALDTAGYRVEDVALLWIDVEGHEGHVLAGAPRALASGAPVVLEYWPYGLHRVKSGRKIVDAFAGSHPRFIDIREAVRTGSLQFMPTGDLPLLDTRLAYRDHTDLLFLPASP